MILVVKKYVYYCHFFLKKQVIWTWRVKHKLYTVIHPLNSSLFAAAKDEMTFHFSLKYQEPFFIKRLNLFNFADIQYQFSKNSHCVSNRHLFCYFEPIFTGPRNNHSFTWSGQGNNLTKWINLVWQKQALFFRQHLVQLSTVWGYVCWKD